MKVKYHDLVASVCMDDYSSFVRTFWPTIVPEKLTWNWHMETMCDEAQSLCERMFLGKPKRHDEINNVCFGSSKSLIWTVFLMPWVWTRMPSACGIFASYSYDLSVYHSFKSRDVIYSELYQKCFPQVRIRDDADSKDFFQTTQLGWRYSVGVKGMVTGRHAHLIVVDDPIDPRGAASEKELAAANRWMAVTIPSRVVDKMLSWTALVMQRLRMGDPTEHMLSFGGCRHLCLPAEVNLPGMDAPKPGEPTERAPVESVKPASLLKFYGEGGGLMDPTRLSRPALWAMQQKLGTWGYAAQCLQEPAPEGGNLFDVRNIRVEDDRPTDLVRLVRAWDKAGTSGSGAWTVGVLMGVTKKGRYWVLDVVRGQWNSADRERTIAKTAIVDGRRVPVVIEEEPSASGKESAESTMRNLAGFKIKRVKSTKAEGGKIDRADPYSVQVNAGNVSIVKAHWNQAYLNELKHFPHTTYKDQTDASSLGFGYLFKPRVQIGALLPGSSWEQSPSGLFVPV